jgi:RNA polymerase sigma-70 factor (ECF subfamily)
LAGEPHAFELLVRRYGSEVYRFVLRFTNSSAGADDVVQDAFLQVHLSAEGFDPKRRFKPWLFTIAANKARDWLRGRSRRNELPLDAEVSDDVGARKFLDLISDGTDGEAPAVEREEQRRTVRRAMDRMPVMMREALILAYYHGFAYHEIADVLGIPVGTVKSRLHSAVAYFGQAYRAIAGESGTRKEDTR